MGLTYKDAGVDIEAGYESVKKIAKSVKSTFNKQVLDNFGSFGGLFQPDLSQYKEPVLVSGTDGVGTKLLLAIELGLHKTIGIDLVAMCVNDVICLGAKPLFMLDYVGIHKVEPALMEEIVEGIADGCRQSGCALIGGETAEMRDVYKKGDYDLAGFVVGIVDKSTAITGESISEGDSILMLPSSGLHSNGYSLARKVAEIVQDSAKQLELKKELLVPTKIYVKHVLDLISKYQIDGIANITGGGLYENVARVLSDKYNAIIDYNNWERLPIFSKLQEIGNISTKEMLNTFNMGVGMVIVVKESVATEILKNEPDIKKIGAIATGSGDVIINGI